MMTTVKKVPRISRVQHRWCKAIVSVERGGSPLPDTAIMTSLVQHRIRLFRSMKNTVQLLVTRTKGLRKGIGNPELHARNKCPILESNVTALCSEALVHEGTQFNFIGNAPALPPGIRFKIVIRRYERPFGRYRELHRAIQRTHLHGQK
jgi:hypothetical protein